MVSTSSTAGLPRLHVDPHMTSSRNTFLHVSNDAAPVRLDEDDRTKRVADSDEGDARSAHSCNRRKLLEAECSKDASDDRDDDEQQRCNALNSVVRIILLRIVHWREK